MFDSNFIFDSNFVNVTIEPRNSTHLGEIRLKIFKDIDKIHFKVGVDAKYTNASIAKYELDGCRFAQEHRENWLLKIFVNYLADIFDLSIINCPMKRGKYVVRRIQKIPAYQFPVPIFVSIDEVVASELMIEAIPRGMDSPKLILQAKQHLKFLYTTITEPPKIN